MKIIPYGGKSDAFDSFRRKATSEEIINKFNEISKGLDLRIVVE